MPTPSLHALFPLSAAVLARLGAAMPNPEGFPEAQPELLASRPWLRDLAAIDRAAHRSGLAAIPESVSSWQINPSVELLETGWQGLPELIRGTAASVEPGNDLLLIYRPAAAAELRIARAARHQLLALKILVEQLDSTTVAVEGGTTTGRIDDLLDQAAAEGVLLAPASALVRPASPSGEAGPGPGGDAAETFALQWHLTQECDLHCRHCYDRSSRPAMELDQCLDVLDQLYRFCRTHHVHGQVSFSGGNPLLSPHFFRLYREAADLGLLTAILGNPVAGDTLSRILAIRKPEFFQVSLEGLPEHNDYIRGRGHFARTLDFLDLLREHGIYSMVMLTLTSANQQQVLDLARLLKGRTDLFTFNRLAMVGEGAALASAPTASYLDFLDQYLAAATGNPHMALKDNLFNLRLEESGRPLTGGCAGFGCGAAFNFLAVLPDGEVHACRKLPSPIGSLVDQDLDTLYHSARAAQYRRGPAKCHGCSIRPVCGGCLAVSHGFGLDIFEDADPYCPRQPGAPDPQDHSPSGG